jgi:peptide/nickel transport system ATP-binding protein
MTDPMLEVTDLVITTTDENGAVTRLVDEISFTVARGETFCLVGESGSGKSLTMLAVMGLLPPGVELSSGSIVLNGVDIAGWDDRRLRELRGRELAMVFQDPMTSLNPLRRVGRQLESAVALHAPHLDRRTRAARATELLTAVGVPRAGERAKAFPHQWSGGMRQRAMIAMAMAHDPELLIADEPTTALDVTIQAQVMSVLAQARQRTGSGLILITHDLGLVAGVADRVAIMYSGRIVETGTVQEIYGAPSHPYTAGLLASVLSGSNDRAVAIPGSPPLASKRPDGCAFAPRCSRADDVCGTAVPTLRIGPRPIETRTAGHAVACHHAVDPVGSGGSR